MSEWVSAERLKKDCMHSSFSNSNVQQKGSCSMGLQTMTCCQLSTVSEQHCNADSCSPEQLYSRPLCHLFVSVICVRDGPYGQNGQPNGTHEWWSTEGASIRQCSTWSISALQGRLGPERHAQLCLPCSSMQPMHFLSNIYGMSQTSAGR